MQERKPQNRRLSDLIRAGQRDLSAAGIDTAQLESELIWAHVLNTTQLKLHTHPEWTPDAESVRRAVGMFARRERREPLQHILGEEHFFGLAFSVNPDVLIPRPETELLVEQAVAFLRERDEPVAFDLGTGSGCIPVSIAHELPGARLVSSDISEAATSLARSNAERHGVADRITFLNGDGFGSLQGSGRFDLIVSNPPYIPTATLGTLQPEVRDFDPRLALDGGEDGLNFYRRLALESGRWLKPDGKIMLELGHDQSAAVHELFEGEMWIVERVIDDYSRIPRILIARPADVAGDGG